MPPAIEAKNVLFLNQLLDYVAGAGDRLTMPIDPSQVFLRPGFRLCVRGPGFSRGLNLQLPDPTELRWNIPEAGQPWRNDDMAAFTYFLALAPLRFEPDTEGRLPLPSDFVQALATQSLEDGFGVKAQAAASDLVSRLSLTFRVANVSVPPGFGGGYHAATLASRYQAFRRDDLDTRQRILHWDGLPNIAPDSSRLVGVGEASRQLTYRQAGLATPLDTFDPAGEDKSALLTKDTRIRSVAPEIFVPVDINATRIYVPVATTVADMEQLLGGAVQSLARRCRKFDIDALASFSEVAAALAAGDLIPYPARDDVPAYPAGDGPYWLHTHFEKYAPRLKSLGAADANTSPVGLKQALMVGAFDRITLR